MIRAAILLVLLSACALPQHGDRHELQVTVIYSDLDTINYEARNRGYRSQANGFFDPVKNELWCPDKDTADALRTCGHELRHAVKGRFHD